MAMYTNGLVQQQPSDVTNQLPQQMPPGGGRFNGPMPYYGTGTRDSPTSMALGMNSPGVAQGYSFNPGMGMDARPIPSPTQQPLSMPSAAGGQFSPRAPMPNGPPMGGGGLDRMGSNQVYSPMAPAQRPPQQYSPMAPSPSLPPTGGAAMTSPRQNLRPLQFNGRAGGLFGIGDR